MKETQQERHAHHHGMVLEQYFGNLDSNDDGACAHEQADHGICYFSDGSVIFESGQDAEAVYYILSGATLLCRSDRAGKIQILEALGERAFVGVSTEPRYDYRAVAMTRTIAARLGSEQVRQSAQLQALITEQLTNSLARMHDRVACCGHKAAPRLVANMLLSLPKCWNPRILGSASQRNWDVRVMMTDAELANCVNLAHQTVRRVLANLRADGIVRMLTPRLLAIRDHATLDRLQQGERLQAHPRCYYEEKSTRKSRTRSDPLVALPAIGLTSTAHPQRRGKSSI